MLTFYDSQNQLCVLGERLGAGGEGTVYACEDSGLVAKIYHVPVTQEKAEKLRWMAANKNGQLLKVAAWVVDVLRDEPGGKIVGFMMPSVRAKEIHELYSLKSRRVYFPEATWHFLVHTAGNVARAFYNLHENAHIMGDVNHGNCVVLADGTVKLIDCDSYSIKTDKLRYPCEVGVATHLAPELQGVNLGSVERESKHDNFGLAVIIFQLLFLGRHPFAGNYLGAEDKSIEDCIRELRFAYGANAKSKHVAQPPGTLPLEAVSPRVAGLFERAFLTEDRPAPREWIEALEDLSDNLEQCALHPGHLFYRQNALCPWCEIETQTGVMLFPFVTTVPLKNRDGKSFDIITIENLIASFNIPPNFPAKLRENEIALPPSPEIVKAHREQRNQQLLIVGFYFVALFLATLVIGGGCAFVLGIVATVILYNRFGEVGKMIRLEARDRLVAAQNKLQSVEGGLTQNMRSSDLERNLTQIRDKIGDYHVLQNDIDEWRGSSEKQIVDSANKSDSEKTKIELSSELTQKRRTIEHEISNLLASLRIGAVRINRYQHHLRVGSQSVIRELAQAESNIKLLGSNLPVGIILGLITIGTPIFGSIIQHSKFTPAANAPLIVANNNMMQSDYGNQAGKFSVPPAAKMGVFIPEENIADKEINKIPAAERTDITLELIRQAEVLTDNKNYAEAEKKLKFALRFDDKNILLLNKFGNLFYEQKKYSESLKYLQRSKNINDNEDANFYIGMNYLQMKNYFAAKEVFVKLTDGAMKNNASFYDLGLAYQGLKNYPAAITAFQKSLNFDPNDLDSTYQIGICFAKTGDRDSTQRSYEVLLERDGKRAANFAEAVSGYVNLHKNIVKSDGL